MKDVSALIKALSFGDKAAPTRIALLLFRVFQQTFHLITMFANNDSTMFDFLNQPHVTLHDQDNGLGSTPYDPSSSTETVFVFGTKAKAMTGLDMNTSVR
jgi:hypothetical protein